MEAEPLQHKSRIMWMLETLGIFGLLMVVAGVVAFALSLLIVTRGRGALAGAALVFIVPMPLMVALFAVFRSAISMFSVVAMSDVQLKASEVAGGIAECLFTPIVGLVVTIPAYMVAMIGLIVRSLRDESPRPPSLPAR